MEYIEEEMKFGNMGLRFEKENYFSCYSPRVYEHLIKNGFETYKDDKLGFKGSFLNIKTSKTCHIFLKDDKLNACIAEVSNVK